MSEFVPPATRKQRLPEERRGVTHHFSILTKRTDPEGLDRLVEIDGYLQTGEYEDGRLGEIFLKVGKAGAESAWIDQWALLFSVALQYGAPVEELAKKFVGTNFEPYGATKNKDIPRCTSVLDYVARYLLAKYGRKS